ncbi:hypothetical protein [Burkholderia sp. SCN-KJ]|uniref:hypothetical protein n=1 Tax=Burkholderia sp. SCN-KJ TaxID=2969248 RepID=UPI00214F61E6|nr:hypothetical protein [Burkholderia sp. SCN-KJ]MCR4468727.1 hypothetical protein [Burkholderia sp. SCN-KJ]
MSEIFRVRRADVSLAVGFQAAASCARAVPDRQIVRHRRQVGNRSIDRAPAPVAIGVCCFRAPAIRADDERHEFDALPDSVAMAGSVAAMLNAEWRT